MSMGKASIAQPGPSPEPQWLTT